MNFKLDYQCVHISLELHVFSIISSRQRERAQVETGNLLLVKFARQLNDSLI